MIVSGPQRGLFLGCLGVGTACLLALDFVAAPAAWVEDGTGDAATDAPRAAEIDAAVQPSSVVPPTKVMLPAAARVPTIVARFDSLATEPVDEIGIRALATAMIEDHGATVVLEGHSDTRGGDDYNHEISLGRAIWVKDRLVALGVSGTRIEAVGLGATRPLHSDTDAQSSVNRRVEVRWIGR